MSYRPENYRIVKEFTCPECGEVYVLAGVGPGNYWETKKDHDEEIRKYKEFEESLIRRKT